jgi:hypothetical protein
MILASTQHYKRENIKENTNGRNAKIKREDRPKGKK